jgi:hypothetical protein
VALLRTDVSEEVIAYIIRVTIIGELGTLADSFHPDDGGAKFSETSVLTRAIRHIIPEDAIFYSHRRESHKSYIALSG